MTRKLTPMMYDGFDRGLASIARATAIAATLCFAVAAPLRAADQPSTNAPAMTPAPAAAPTKDNATAAPAAVAPAAATPAATGPTKSFTEEDVNAAVKKVVDERTKDGAFVFHDPKLDADLHLIFDQIKNVRGMEGYVASRTLSFTTRTSRRSSTPSTSGSSLRDKT
jgi:hypothetical protein